MPGYNTTGLPNTSDYNLGRGTVYFAQRISGGRPIRYRDLGNAPEFSISVESETLEHQSSQEGLKVTDKEFVISQKVNITLTLDELNFQNLALFFSGTAAEAGYDNDATNTGVNDASAGIAHLWIAGSDVKKGFWYDLIDPEPESANYLLRLYDIQDDADVILADSGAKTVVYVSQEANPSDYDYILDKKMGRIFIHEDSDIPAASLFLEVVADSAATDEVNQVQALTQTAVSGALKFVAENPVAADHLTEYEFHQVSLKAEGDFSLIGDEFTTMQLTGVAERNTAYAELGDSKTLTIRTFTGATA